MLLDKAFLYDWNGGNAWLFNEINKLHGDIYDAAMVLLSRIGDHHNFPYYLIILLVCALFQFGVKKLLKRGGATHNLGAWVGVFLVLIAGYAIEGYIIKNMKDYFAYPRPYITLHDNVRILESRDSEKDLKSFPSGHAAFITLMVIGTWPILSTGMSLCGILLILGVCWSRMAVGMHFPADVLGGFILSLFTVLIIRAVFYKLFLRLFHIKC